MSSGISHRAAAALLVALATSLLSMGSCVKPSRFTVPGGAGDTEMGQRLVFAYGCGSCHVIPGISDASGTVGPPLTRIGVQSYVAGLLPNTPDNLARWIMHPQQIHPQTAMPDMGISEQQARHIAEYLYTLR
jgi:cytochrome c